jgi:tight adherence protein B
VKARSRPRRVVRAALAALAIAVLGTVFAAAAGAVEPILSNEPVIVVTEIERTDDQLILEVVVPPETAGTRLDPSAIGVIADGNYLPALVERPTGSVAVVLAIDVSGSTSGPPLESALDAAQLFLDRLPPDTTIGLVSFAEDVAIVVAPTLDLDMVRKGLKSLAANGPTSLYDGVITSSEVLSTVEAESRIIVLFSDGGDTASNASQIAALTQLRQVDVRVEVVSLDTADSDSVALNALAGKAGRVWPVAAPDDLATAFGSIGDGLGNQFTVTITNPPASVTIVARGDGGLVRQELEILSGVYPAPEPEGAPLVEPAFVAAAPLPTVMVPLEPDTWLGENTGLYGLLAIGLGLFATSAIIAWPTRSQRPAPTRKKRRRSRLNAHDAAQRLADVAEAGLGKGERRSKLAATLEQAGSRLRPGEFVVGVAAAALGTLMIGTLAAGPKMAALLTVLVVLGSRFWLKRRVKKTRAAFASQLGQTLQLLASNLRVGHGLMQGIDAVAREADAPTCHEFRRVTGEVRLGRDTAEALRSMATRLDNDDFRWAVQAIEIHREVGGDLAEVLDNVGATISDRDRLRGQIEALSADGRISAAVMMALPFCVAGLMLMSTPDYLDELTGRTGGQILLGIGALLMTAGAAWLKAIIRLDF